VFGWLDSYLCKGCITLQSHFSYEYQVVYKIRGKEQKYIC